MIESLEIPREHWMSFLQLLGRQLNQRPVRIEVIGEPLGVNDVGEIVRFRGFDYDSNGSLTLTIGGEATSEPTRRSFRPSRLYLGQDEFGEINWLAVEEEGVKTTLVHFERLPELEKEFRP